MSTDIVNAHISTKHMHFTRLQKGWVFREDKTVGCNEWECHSIHVTHIIAVNCKLYAHS